MRGRRPIPTALKAAAGDGIHDSGKRKLPTNEPKPVPGRLAKPKHLSASASAAWDRLIEAIERLGVLSTTDRAAITMCAELLGLAADAYAAMKTEGTTTQHANGTAGPTPCFGIYVKATAQAKALLAEFGLTPSARPRVKVDKPGDDPADFSDLGGGGGRG